MGDKSVHMEDDDAKRRAEQEDTPDDDESQEEETAEEQLERETEMGSVSIGEDTAAAPGQSAGEGTVTEGGGEAGGTSGN